MARILLLANPSEERDGLVTLMRRAGHECTAAEDLNQAAGLLRQEAYDLVLADSVLAGKSSLDAARKLEGAYPGVVVLVLTDEADPLGGASEHAVTLPYAPVQNLAPQFSAIRKREALLVLLPKDDVLADLANFPHTPGALNKLAVLYHSQGNHKAAEQLYKRALEVIRKTVGEDQREAASILNNLASLYHDQERYNEAEQLYKRSLSIVEKVFGSGHPKVMTRLRNLVDLYRAQGKNREVEACQSRLKELERRA